MKKLTKYLLGAFGIAWVFQIIAGGLYQKGNNIAYSIFLALSMFAPLLAAIISKSGVKKLGWKPHIRKDTCWILCAWFGPAVLGTIGAILYFLIFTDAWNSSFSYISSLLGTDGLAQQENKGLSLQLYAVISIVSAVIYAPFINMLLAIGEEAGWRGTMYPILKERLGTTKGQLICGVIWGVWHWPIMFLTGYEYGTSYWGAPVTGPLLFCVITSAMGILFDFLYEKTNCIWVPALCHGAINAFAGVPILFMNPAYVDKLLLGPLMIGVIGGLPFILSAAFICKLEKDYRH